MDCFVGGMWMCSTQSTYKVCVDKYQDMNCECSLPKLDYGNNTIFEYHLNEKQQTYLIFKK